jgi:hypothetical protein
MPLDAVQISYPLDLYHYWLAKRGGHRMPSRSDIDPAEIPALLPHLSLVERVDGLYRYRLFGTGASREIGRDLTGRLVGSYVGADPKSAEALQAVSERVFTSAHPVFATGEFMLTSGAIHNIAVLILPLSDDDTNVNMTVSIRITRFNFNRTAGIDWLKGALLRVSDVVGVDNAPELEKRCGEWERHCDDQRLRAEAIAQRAR